MSKSVAKALRGAIGREKNRGISTFLFAHPGRIRTFATDLDNPRRRGPLHGRRPRLSPRSRAAPPPGGRTRPRAPRCALCTRTGTFNRTSRVQNAHLERIMHISTITGPTRSSLPRTASAHTIPRRPPFQVAGSRRPLVRPRPRRDERGQWCGRGEWGGGPMHSDDRGPVRARVCYAPFPLLRLVTLHCTRKRGAAEGEGAQQTERGVADAKVRRGRPSAIPRGPRATRRGLRNASPAQRNPPHLAPCEPSVTESA